MQVYDARVTEQAARMMHKWLSSERLKKPSWFSPLAPRRVNLYAQINVDAQINVACSGKYRPSWHCHTGMHIDTHRSFLCMYLRHRTIQSIE